MSLDGGGLGEGLLPVAAGVGDRGWTKADSVFLVSLLSRQDGLSGPYAAFLDRLTKVFWRPCRYSALESTPTPNSAA
jgi:hypothetical protein